MKGANIPAASWRQYETGLVWIEKLSNATGQITVPEYSTLRIRATGATAVYIEDSILCTYQATTANTITKASHRLSNNMKVRFNAGIGSLPATLNVTTEYFVVNATIDTFQVSLTLGGAAIALATSGNMAYSTTSFLACTMTSGEVIRLNAGKQTNPDNTVSIKIATAGAYVSIGKEQDAY